MPDNALDHLKAEIFAAVDRMAQHIARGSIGSHEEYKRLCGFIQGLEAAAQLIDDLAKEMETDDE